MLVGVLLQDLRIEAASADIPVHLRRAIVVRRTAKVGRLVPLSRRRQRAGIVARGTHARAKVSIACPAVRTAFIPAGAFAANFELRPRARAGVFGASFGEACWVGLEGGGEGACVYAPGVEVDVGGCGGVGAVHEGCEEAEQGSCCVSERYREHRPSLADVGQAAGVGGIERER